LVAYIVVLVMHGHTDILLVAYVVVLVMHGHTNIKTVLVCVY
jgi:hypothetical protein